jgi:hypothetical protein
MVAHGRASTYSLPGAALTALIGSFSTFFSTFFSCFFST